MFNAKLAEALRTAREGCGLTQNDVADRTGLTRSWINSVEGGRVEQPNSDRLKRLAKLYGVNPSLFLRLAGYDVDESTMPRRKLSDIALELYTHLREIENEDTPDPEVKKEYQNVARAFGMKGSRELQPV